MMPPFVVFPTNRIAHFVEVSLYLFYLAQQVKFIKRSLYLEQKQPRKIPRPEFVFHLNYLLTYSFIKRLIIFS